MITYDKRLLCKQVLLIVRIDTVFSNGIFRFLMIKID